MFVYICLVVEALLFGRQVDTVPCGRVPAVPLTRYRGPTELVQHSADRGISRRRKGANSHLIDMFFRLSQWEGRVSFTCSVEDYLPLRRLDE